MAFSDVVRKEFKVSDEERDKGLTTPDNVVRHDDICYAYGLGAAGSEEEDVGMQSAVQGKETDAWHLLDVYRPKSAGDAKLPVIVNVHGGGWVYGDKDVYQYYCMNLCQRGFAVVNYSYRLAPEYKFPAQLEDTCMAFRWVMENAGEYGFDADRIYAVGDSAGANILGLYCLMCTNEEYGGKYEADVLRKSSYVLRVENPANYVPKAVALNCGAYDLTASRREMKGFMSELMPNKGTPEEVDMLNVIKYLNKDFPPTFIMTCYGDFLKEQAPLLEEKLEDAGVKYVSRFYGDESNPLKHVFHCDIRMDEAKECNDETCEFFRSIG